MAKKYHIRLSTEDREQLQHIVKARKATASKCQRAQIQLAADSSKAGGELRDEDIAQVLDVSIATGERTAARCASMVWRCGGAWLATTPQGAAHQARRLG